MPVTGGEGGRRLVVGHRGIECVLAETRLAQEVIHAAQLGAGDRVTVGHRFQQCVQVLVVVGGVVGVAGVQDGGDLFGRERAHVDIVSAAQYP